MESVAELPPQIEKPKRIPHFTKENAKAYNAKAIEAKRLAAIERNEAIERAKVVTELAPDEKYRLERLARTREQIVRLDAQLLASIDPREIKALSDALKNFAEMERILRREPLPGSRRPGREKPSKSSTASGPLDAE